MKSKESRKNLLVPLMAVLLVAALGVGGALAETATYNCRPYPGVNAVPMFFAPTFANPLPNALDRSFIFGQNPGTYGANAIPYDYQIGAYEIQHDPGLGKGATTTVWGYGQQPQTNPNQLLPGEPSYPARTFFAYKNDIINVRFSNNLTADGSETGTPLSHLLPVDSSLTWADPLEIGKTWGPYCGPVPTVVHLHGGHTESCSDGLPDAWSTPGDTIVGRMWNPVYYFDNSQEAATVWYHDHALGITRLNVYAGLAGFYIIRDANEEALNLPGSPYGDGTIWYPNTSIVVPRGAPSYDQYEIALVIQDRMFVADAAGNPQLYYPSVPPIPGAPLPSTWPEFFGNVILVNGKAWPNLNVEQNRWYRLRLLNGSDSAFYALYLASAAVPLGTKGQVAPVTLYQIGTDLGLLDNPIAVGPRLVIGPGERIDLVVNFGALAVGTKLILKNDAGQPYPNGAKPDPATAGQIMQFSVIANGGAPDPFAVTVAAALNGLVTNVNLRPPNQSIAALRAAMTPTPPGNPRKLILYEAVNSYGRLEPMLGTMAEGVKMYENNITELIQNVGDTEIWEIYNLTPDAHPIHLHLVHFFVLSREKFTAKIINPFSGTIDPLSIKLFGPVLPPAGEMGLKDTVQAYPGEVTRIIATFDKWGEYVWHCHILSHEDHEMMRPFFVGPADPGALRVKKGIGVKGAGTQDWYAPGTGCPR